MRDERRHLRFEQAERGLRRRHPALKSSWTARATRLPAHVGGRFPTSRETKVRPSRPSLDLTWTPNCPIETQGLRPSVQVVQVVLNVAMGGAGLSRTLAAGAILASENRLGRLDTWTDQASNGFYAPLLWEFERARFFLKSDKRRQKATKLHGTYSRACPATLALVTFARRSSGQRSFWKSTAIAGNMPKRFEQYHLSSRTYSDALIQTWLNRMMTHLVLSA